jgi:DNA-binding MarR family transcriptional regulator
MIDCIGGIEELPKQAAKDTCLIPASLRQNLYFVLEMASTKLADKVSEELRGTHNLIPRHYALLSILVENGTMNQQDIGDKVNVNRNMMVQLIDQLEKLQLAERTVNPTNRREHLIVITDKGKKLLTQADKVVRTIEDKCTGLSAQDRKDLVELICKMKCLNA